ncbi:MAG: glycosyltransferase family 1 protein [Candidatus Paceibacterota bacterium]
MRIAHFVGTIKKEDGVGLVLLDLINESVKKGDEVIIITGHVDEDFIVPVPVIKTTSLSFPLYKEYKIPLPGIKGFEKALLDFKPDILHVHSPETSAWAALRFAKKYKVPIAATYHTNFGRYLNYFHLSSLKPILWKYLSNLYNKMDVVTTPSYGATNELAERNIKNVKTIAWGVDTEKFSAAFRSEAWRHTILKENQKTILLYVGRLVWYKDIKTLADTYAMLKKNRTDFALVIVGEGPAKEALRKLLPTALFLGHKQGAELSTIYASSDIFLFPSSTEVFERVSLEAVASNLVTIVADTPAHIITHEKFGFGILAKTKDPASFYEKTSFLLDNPNACIELKSHYSKNITHFTWPEISTEFTKLYSKISIKKE